MTDTFGGYQGPSQPYIGKDTNLDSYDKVPIEDYGKSILSKLGWQEGKGIGRTVTQIVEPVEYIGRPKKLGLGAKPSDL